MIEERGPALGDRNGFVDARAMRVAGLEHVGSVVLQEDIFAIVDVAFRLAVGDFLDAPSQPIVAIGRRGCGRGIPRGEIFHLRQAVLRVIRELGKVARGEEGLSGAIPVVVVLVREVRIRRELIARVDDTPTGGSVAHGSIGKGLGGAQQRMAGTGQPIQTVIAERLRPSSIGQTRQIPHAVVGVGGLIDLGRTRYKLVQDIRDLTGGIVAVRYSFSAFPKHVLVLETKSYEPKKKNKEG